MSERSLDMSGFDDTPEMPELDSHINAKIEQAQPVDGVDEPSAELPKRNPKLAAPVETDLWAEPTDEPAAPEQEAAGDQETEGETPEVEPALPGRKLTLQAEGGLSVDIGDGMLIPVKVDGKTMRVPVSELISNFSGKTAWDKRFSELTTEKRGFTQERQAFQQTQAKSASLIQDLHKNIASGDTFSAIASLVQLSGLDGKVDPRAYVSEIRAALLQQAKELEAMDPAERAHREAQEEIAYSKKQLAELRGQREREQAEYTAQVEFAKEMQKNQVSMEELTTARDYLVENAARHGLDVSKLSAKEFMQHALTVREYSTAIEALSSVSPELAENPQYQDDAVKLLRAYPGTSSKELAEVLQEAFGQMRGQTVSAKAAKSPTPVAAVAKAKAKMAPRRSGGIDLSTITEEDVNW
jgi:hypothetical protein